MHEEDLKRVLNKQLEPIKKQLKGQGSVLVRIGQKLKAQGESLVTIETKIDNFADAYKQNQRNIEKLDKRLDLVEDDLGIEPREDLKIHYKTSELI